MDRRTRLAEIFADTERFIKEKPVLSQSAESSCKGTKLYDLHRKRAKGILNTAAVNGVDILITDAFGCEAFANDPHTVAEAWRDAVSDYRKFFSAIEFAVYCRPYETENLKTFERIIGSKYDNNK